LVERTPCERAHIQALTGDHLLLLDQSNQLLPGVHRLEQEVAIDNAQNRLRLGGQDRHYVGNQRRVAREQRLRIASRCNEFDAFVARRESGDFDGCVDANNPKAAGDPGFDAQPVIILHEPAGVHTRQRRRKGSRYDNAGGMDADC
jgi:hypothetical protein